MLKPVGNRLLVQPVEVKAGLILTPGAKPTQFKVIDAGAECKYAEPGDIIYLDKYVGAAIEHDGDKYLVVEEDGILAIVD